MDQVNSFLPLIGISFIFIAILFILLNKLLWGWYLDIVYFKEHGHKMYLESKKQTELLKLLCEQKGIDLNTISKIDNEKRPKANIFVKE